MELSKRLLLISSMVDKCNSIVDVGTDHGYVPIQLIKCGVCLNAIASDINRGPVEKAEINIGLEGLEKVIECRQGSGLSTISVGEVNGAVIAGMGGNLIKEIIEDGIEVFKRLQFAVLQPVQNAEVLRKFVYESGFKILDEELCYEDDKFYEILKVAYGEEKVKLSEFDYEISPLLLSKKHPLIKDFIDFKLRRYRNIYKLITEDTESALARKSEVAVKIEKLKELLLCL